MVLSRESMAEELKKWIDHIKGYQANDFEMMYDDWVNQSFYHLDEKVKYRFFSRLDTWLFHSHAFLQGTSFQNDARERILKIGRIFNNEIEEINDMKELSIDQLTYIAEQQVARGRLYSFAQGGLTGTGGWLLLGVDFPVMMILNLRAVQLIGLTFGHEMNHPYEMLLSLKVFHAATLPKRMQSYAWEDLAAEVKNQKDPYVFEANDQLTNEKWLEQPFKQTFKSLFILMFRKKLFQGIPLISVGIGAYSNFQLTKQVTEFALKFYQYRYFKMEQENGHDYT
ncbi:EcsC family protein [Halobacillus salinarum]|uniref:EcsC family protein n=1 Tax=Halobacillus salinarum TaxID=2932257 RepID=A0ABY4ENW4_9BACI|nr:EcsC family protein [Halobacillus salinarum]UOQ46148.1 EcsC family protein [Halobacillus salinarum]